MVAIIKILKDIFQIPELRRRILITFILLAVFRLGFHIFLPGINIGAYLESTKEEKQRDFLDWVSYTSRLTGGKFDHPVIFSLGIMPYITASIIFSLMVKVFPRLEALSKEGEQGRRLINRYTRYSTVLICVVQSILLINQWQKPTGTHNQYIMIEPDSVFIYPFLQILCLTTGSLFLMWLGEKITEIGIGNGTSLIIMVGIIAGMPGAFTDQISMIKNAAADERPFVVVKALILLGLYFGVVAAVVFITKGQRRIPVQQQRSIRGKRVFGGQRSYMPFRVNPAGVLPIIFAQSLIVLPAGLIGVIANSPTLPNGIRQLLHFLHDAFQRTSLLYLITYITLIIFFTYFWTSLMFNPVEIANNMKEYGSFIPGIRPGKRTAEYLEKVMKRITLAGAAFLSVIALVPQIVNESLDVGYLVAGFLGGTGILIVVGVALDLVDKIEAQLLVRQYEGFMRGGEGPRRGSGPVKESVPTV